MAGVHPVGDVGHGVGLLPPAQRPPVVGPTSRPPEPDLPGPERDPDDFQLVDFEQIKNWRRFVLHAVARRKLLLFFTFAVSLAAALSLISIMPRTYRVDALLLAERNSLMPALGNPGRSVPADSDSPTRAANETVKRRDNLATLVKQTDLMAEWERSRPGVLRSKDTLRDRLLGPRSDEEKLNDMLDFLDDRLRVTVGESTISISIDWPNAEMATKLVNTAQQNFLEQRYSAEVSTIEETIKILEGYLSALREAIDQSMDELKQAESSGARTSSRTMVIPRRDPVSAAVRAEAAELRIRLETKQRNLTELEEFRRKRLSELQAELAQQRTIYADAHPAIVRLRESLAVLQQESPQVQALKAEVSDLQAEQLKLAAGREAFSPSRTSEVEGRQTLNATPDFSKDYARTRVRFAMEKHDALVARIDSARIELDTAKAAFKYRYNVLRPAMIPKKPVKPKVPTLVLMGLLGSLGLAVAATVVADLRSDRVLEIWQLEKRFRLRVFGEVPRA
jgi:uncharacterized protein involved in exopolysaccharide biosynthesis